MAGKHMTFEESRSHLVLTEVAVMFSLEKQGTKTCKKNYLYFMCFSSYMVPGLLSDKISVGINIFYDQLIR